MKKIAILGSTGSIGTQTLEVVEHNGDIQVEALSANGNVELLEKQARKFHPSVIAVFREAAAKDLKERLKDTNIRIVTGMDGLIEIATLPETDILVTAIVGMIGILPTIEAIKAGKDIALANKETSGDSRPYHHASGRADGCSDPSGGQRAQRHFPGTSRGRQGRNREDSYHSFRRAFPGKRPGGTGWRTGGGRPETSELVYGTEDHD